MILKTLLSITLAVILALSVNAQEDELLDRIVPGKEYNLQAYCNTDHGHLRPIKITLFRDGTYTRTEDVSVRFLPGEENPSLIMGVYINDLRGTWKVVDGSYYFNDEQIVDYECVSRDGFIKCKIEEDRINFALAEWFDNFRVTCIKSDVIALGEENWIDKVRR